MRSLALLFGSCLVGAAAVRLGATPAAPEKAPVNATRLLKAAWKIWSFQMSGCKRINPGTPLPEGKFNWDTEDFNPEALKMSPCGQDGESKIFDSAADETGEQGLAVAGQEVMQVLKGFAGALLKKKPDGTLDIDAMFTTLDVDGDGKITLTEAKTWMGQQTVANGNNNIIREEIFDAWDEDKKDGISKAELKSQCEKMDKTLLTPKSQTSLVAQKGSNKKVNATARDMKAAWKLWAYQMSGCKKTKINPGTPLPEGKFNWDIEDFNPEALKMSPCGQDGESKIFDNAADETGEQGLAMAGDAVTKIIKSYAGALFRRKADGTLDIDRMFKTLDTDKAGVSDEGISLAELEKWMDVQPVAGGNDPNMRAEIFDAWDTNGDKYINKAELTSKCEEMDATLLAPRSSVFLSQK